MIDAGTGQQSRRSETVEDAHTDAEDAHVGAESRREPDGITLFSASAPTAMSA